MKHLYLLRHALPERTSQSGEDRDRPLSPAGIEQARRMGAFMHENGYIPDFIACSPAARTRGTLEQLGFDGIKTEFVKDLYLPHLQELEDYIAYEAPSDAGNILIVSHYPGVLEFLLEHSNHEHGFPESALAIFDSDLKLVEFTPPKD